MRKNKWEVLSLRIVVVILIVNSCYVILDERQVGTFEEPKNPLLKGNKIFSATLCNDITLTDLYVFVTTALSKFPALCNTEKERTGFPTLVQSSGLLEVCRPAPQSQYYEPDTFSL